VRALGRRIISFRLGPVALAFWRFAPEGQSANPILAEQLASVDLGMDARRKWTKAGSLLRRVTNHAIQMVVRSATFIALVASWRSRQSARCRARWRTGLFATEYTQILQLCRGCGSSKSSLMVGKPINQLAHGQTRITSPINSLDRRLGHHERCARRQHRQALSSTLSIWTALSGSGFRLQPSTNYVSRIRPGPDEP